MTAPTKDSTHSRAEANKNVSRGAALLDSREPGWYHRVNLGTINLYSTSRCILGQVFGSGGSQGYTRGLSALGLDLAAEEFRHGFLPNERVDHDDLVAAWRREVARRHLPAPFPAPTSTVETA